MTAAERRQQAEDLGLDGHDAESFIAFHAKEDAGAAPAAEVVREAEPPPMMTTERAPPRSAPTAGPARASAPPPASQPAPSPAPPPMMVVPVTHHNVRPLANPQLSSDEIRARNFGPAWRNADGSPKTDEQISAEQEPPSPPPMYGPAAPVPYKPPQMTEATGPDALPDPWHRGWSPDEAEQWRTLRAKDPSIHTPDEKAAIQRHEEYARQDQEAGGLASLLPGDYAVGARAAIDPFKRPERTPLNQRPTLSPMARMLRDVQGIERDPVLYRAPDPRQPVVVVRPAPHNPRPAATVAAPVSNPALDDATDYLISEGYDENEIKQTAATPEGRQLLIQRAAKLKYHRSTQAAQ